MKFKFTLFIALIALLSSQNSQAQVFLYPTATPINLSDTLTYQLRLSEGPQLLLGGQLFMEVDFQKFKFLSIRSEISDIQDDNYDDFFSLTENGDDSIDLLSFAWTDSELNPLDTAQTGDLLLEVRFQARENMDNLNDFIYVLSGESQTSFFQNSADSLILPETQASIQEGNGVVSIRYVTQESFAFQATKAGKLSYLIAQVDGKVLASFEREVQVGDNVIDFPIALQDQLQTGIYILSVSDGHRRYARKFFAQ